MAILSETPEGAKVLDLAAARVARAEARGEKSYLKLNAGFVEVQPEVALAAADAFVAGDIKKGVSLLVADPADADLLIADGLTAEDLEAIIEHISGKSLGESSAS